MGVSKKEEQTPEEKLVDELVGIGMQIEGKVRDDAPSDKQREIKSIVKKSWVNGASCEEIERTYNENIEKSILLEESGDEDNKFSKKLSGFGTSTKKRFQKIDLNFVNNKGFKNTANYIQGLNIKNNTVKWWKDRKIFDDNPKPKNEYSNLVLNKKNTGSFNRTSNKRNNRFPDNSLNQEKVSSLNETLNQEKVSSLNESLNRDKVSSLNESLNRDKVSSLNESLNRDKVSSLNRDKVSSLNRDKVSSLNRDKVSSLNETPIQQSNESFNETPNKQNNRYPDYSSVQKNSVSFNEISNKQGNRFPEKTPSKLTNKSFNEKLASKFRKPQKDENHTSDNQSFIDVDEKKYKQESKKENLVDELVGIGSSSGKKLNSLAIPEIYKFAIKTTVQAVWKEGRPVEEIQKTYDDLVTTHLQDKEELDKQKSLKMEIDELKKELLFKEEEENNKLKFEGYFQEINQDLSINHDKEFFCSSYLEENTILIEKKKPLSKNFCGENKILYLDILSCVYEKENPQYDYVQIFTNGFNCKLINKNRDNSLKDFYDKLMEKINDEKTFYQKNIKKDEKSSYSKADELIKWHELKEKGVITPEEFEEKKNKLL